MATLTILKLISIICIFSYVVLEPIPAQKSSPADWCDDIYIITGGTQGNNFPILPQRTTCFEMKGDLLFTMNDTESIDGSQYKYYLYNSIDFSQELCQTPYFMSLPRGIRDIYHTGNDTYMGIFECWNKRKACFVSFTCDNIDPSGPYSICNLVSKY